MTSIIVLSDTHGNRRAIDELSQVLGESDMIIHLGDTSGDGGYIRTAFPDKTRVINGNCDPVKLGENELVLEVEGVRIFATHGHLYSVKSTLLKLADRAKELGCAFALYGHTHVAKETLIDGVTLLNPGAFTRFCQKSYLYIAVNGDKLVYKHVDIS